MLIYNLYLYLYRYEYRYLYDVFALVWNFPINGCSKITLYIQTIFAFPCGSKDFSVFAGDLVVA